MPITDQITQGYKASSGNTTSVVKSYSADAAIEYADPIPASTTNLALVIAVDVSQMKTALLYASKPLTIKLNSTSSPVATITLAAGQSIVWAFDYVAANPLGTTDVTTLYVTNAGIVAADFRFRALVDVTPSTA